MKIRLTRKALDTLPGGWHHDDQIPELWVYAGRNGCTWYHITNRNYTRTRTKIGDSAFAHRDKLTDITIPGSITTVREDTFASCDKLSEVTILDGVTTIEGRAFVSCNNLSKITIPDSVTFINGSAFDFCDKLKTLEIPQNCTCERGYFFLGKVIRGAK